MLYETAARSAEVLRLDVGDLDMPNRKARVRRKGGAVDVIVWQTGTARLLPRLLDGRIRGSVFLTGRRARVALAAENGANTGTLLAYSGHASVASLARYTRVSPTPSPDGRHAATLTGGAD